MRSVRSALPALAAVLGLALVVSACGGGGSSGDGVATASGDGSSSRAVSAKTPTDPQEAALEFARCMREHGVDMEDPVAGQPGGFAIRVEGGPGSGASDGAGTKVVPGDSEAFAACQPILDDAIASSDAKIDPEMQDRALKFAQCMRDHGVDMPDPQFSGGGIRMEISGNLDPNSPTMQAAHEACAQYLGKPGEGGGPGGGGGKGGFVTSGPVASSAAAAKASGS